MLPGTHDGEQSSHSLSSEALARFVLQQRTTNLLPALPTCLLHYSRRFRPMPWFSVICSFSLPGSSRELSADQTTSPAGTRRDVQDFRFVSRVFCARAPVMAGTVVVKTGKLTGGGTDIRNPQVPILLTQVAAPRKGNFSHVRYSDHLREELAT